MESSTHMEGDLGRDSPAGSKLMDKVNPVQILVETWSTGSFFTSKCFDGFAAFLVFLSSRKNL